MNDTTEPLIKVSVFGETKTVGPKNKVGSGQIYWGDHMFFTKKIDESRFFFSQKLKIEILNYHKIGKNSIIGEISLDLISIFKEQKHALLHQWAGISNFGKNYEEILGFLKFSVTITGEKDDPIVLEKERTLSQKDRRKNTDHIGGGGSSGAEVLMPPHLRTKGFQMKISLVKGEQFMKLDLIGTIDSYIIAEFGNARYETEPIKDNQNPIYGLIIYVI